MYQSSHRPAVSVIVPYRPDDGCRDRVWAWLKRRWSTTGWEVVTGTCPPGPWVKGIAVADAAARASGDVIVVADADCLSETGIGEAVDAVTSGARWAVPHTAVHRLSRHATSAVLDGGPIGGPLEQRPYKGVTGGGIVVLSRDALAECPMDPRFAGWGQEDQAWGLALTTLYGEPPRSTEPLWHLWHEPQDRLSRSTGSMGGRMLLRQYQSAAGDPGRIRALLAEKDETREPGMSEMWVYRNKNSGDEHAFPERHARLDRLGNWDLVSQPQKPEPRPETEPAGMTLVVAPALPAGITEPVALPVTRGETGEQIATVRVPGRPAVNRPKSEWVSYAQSIGVQDAESMPKTALIRACG